MLGQAAQFSPDIIDIVNFEESLRILGDRLAVPGEALRSEEEIMQMRAMKAQQAEEQKMTNELMQAAEGIGKAGPGIKALQEANETETMGAPA